MNSSSSDPKTGEASQAGAARVLEPGASDRAKREPTSFASRLARRIRVLLVLGRISNLPTVWSNCLAGWLLGNEGHLSRLALLCAGASLLYTGGMFLNDAFDQEFDRRFRPERPIVSGQISARSVWRSGFALLALGWLLILPLGRASGLTASALLITIIIYDAVHKRTVLAPVLMALCRFLLYLSAGLSSLNPELTSVLLWPAAALAIYIVGLSYLARGESRPARRMSWSVPLLCVPAIAALILHRPADGLLWGVVVLQVGWTAWCLTGAKAALGVLSRGVAGLLAGIALVDWVAAAQVQPALGILFVALFAAALLLQKAAPAT